MIIRQIKALRCSIGMFRGKLKFYDVSNYCEMRILISIKTSVIKIKPKNILGGTIWRMSGFFGGVHVIWERSHIS